MRAHVAATAYTAMPARLRARRMWRAVLYGLASIFRGKCMFQIKGMAAGGTVIVHPSCQIWRAVDGRGYHDHAAACAPHDRQRGHGNCGAKVSGDIIGKNPDGDTEEEAQPQHRN